MSSIHEIKRRNRAAGRHFFDPDAMKLFGSRVSKVTFGDFFVTSEMGPSGVRAYTVRHIGADGAIRTVGDYQRWSTLREAHCAAERAWLNSEGVAA